MLRKLARGLARAAKRLSWLSVRYPTLSLGDRLAQFSQLQVDWPVGCSVRFNAHFVPYIMAREDAHAAFALGVVTEFQRGPQLQFLKRLAQGRLSEMGGRQFVDMDHLIRLLGFDRSCQAVWEAMPVASRQWVEHFTAGLNVVLAQRKRGVDERLLGIHPEPYTPLDILRYGRLAGADVNWPLYFSLIEHRIQGETQQWWALLRKVGAGLHTSFDPQHASTSPAQKIAQFLSGISRSGSNSIALHASRTQSGYPMMVNDPHLGLHLPNVWMMVGLRSPSYQCVGLMFPGVPILGLGRNPNLAWGGTNLRAASSDLVRLSDESLQQAKVTTTCVRVRWGFTRKRNLRVTSHGPVLTDCAALGKLLTGEHLALRWAGHWPTDEITCFLTAMRSTTVAQLQAAMAGVGVTPLNVLGADRAGNIGHVLAATLPARDNFPEEDWVLSEAESTAQWAQPRSCARHYPSIINPAQGYLVSANNRPADAPGLGFLFNGDDRILRARSLMGSQRRFSPQTLLAAQLDVVSPLADVLSSHLAQFCRPYVHQTEHAVLCNAIDRWPGDYSSGSFAALQFEFLLTALVRELSVLRHGGRVPGLMDQWSYLTEGLLGHLNTLTEPERQAMVPKCVEQANQLAQHWQLWGNVHKIRLRHVLGHVPILGKLFSSKSFPAAGSRETLMKNAHGLIKGFGESAYGSQARHLSDLSDADANYFVLLGGQDGWVGSQMLTDQLALWQTRQSIQMPLRPARVQELFPHAFGRLE